MTLTGERFFVSVRGETAEEVGALWDKLADGADLIEKYGPSPWAPGLRDAHRPVRRHLDPRRRRPVRRLTAA